MTCDHSSLQSINAFAKDLRALVINRIADLINPGGRVMVTAGSLHRGLTYGEYKGILGPDGAVVSIATLK
jgi:hypothetical protein